MKQLLGCKVCYVLFKRRAWLYWGETCSCASEWVSQLWLSWMGPALVPAEMCTFVPAAAVARPGPPLPRCWSLMTAQKRKKIGHRIVTCDKYNKNTPIRPREISQNRQQKISVRTWRALARCWSLMAAHSGPGSGSIFGGRCETEDTSQCPGHPDIPQVATAWCLMSPNTILVTAGMEVMTRVMRRHHTQCVACVCSAVWGRPGGQGCGEEGVCHHQWPTVGKVEKKEDRGCPVVASAEPGAHWPGSSQPKVGANTRLTLGDPDSHPDSHLETQAHIQKCSSNDCPNAILVIFPRCVCGHRC